MKCRLLRLKLQNSIVNYSIMMQNSVNCFQPNDECQLVWWCLPNSTVAGASGGGGKKNVKGFKLYTEGDPNGILIKVVVKPKYGSSNKKSPARTQISIGTVR